MTEYWDDSEPNYSNIQIIQTIRSNSVLDHIGVLRHIGVSKLIGVSKMIGPNIPIGSELMVD